MGRDQYVVSVTVQSPTVEDGGQWRCNAFNPFGDSNANIALNFEKGKAIPEGFAPTFLDKPSIIPNESGTMITMKVRCKAKPQPTVEWFKDGKKLEAGKRLVIKEHKVTAEMFEYSCIVKKPQPTDGGVYKCNIKNEFGELNANLNLNIEVAPTIKKPPKFVSIFNRKVIMECVVMSTSKPACSWYKDATKVKLDTRHCINITEESEGKYMVQMEMLKVEKFDCGAYKLIAKNEKGDTTSQTVDLTEAMLEEKKEEKKEEVKEEKVEKQEKKKKEEQAKVEEETEEAKKYKRKSLKKAEEEMEKVQLKKVKGKDKE